MYLKSYFVDLVKENDLAGTKGLEDRIYENTPMGMLLEISPGKWQYVKDPIDGGSNKQLNIFRKRPSSKIIIRTGVKLEC